MAKQKSTTTKQSLSPETRKTLEAVQKGVERFSEMAHGIHGFCYNVDEGREEVYNFSCAIATIAEMLQEDAERIAGKIAGVLKGGM